MPRGSRTTLKDIADEVGLSVTAVSLVLNNREVRLSQDNVRRIREVAKRRNYRANSVARSLAMRRTNAFGLLVPDIENPFFASLAKSLEESARAAGSILIVVNSNDDPEADCRLLDTLASREVDGLFLTPSNAQRPAVGRADLGEGSLREALGSLSMPYVLVDRVLDDIECDKVSFNNERGAQMAVDLLIRKGHRRIACVANTYSGNGRERLLGYRAALQQGGIEFDPSLVIESDYHEKSGYEAGRRLCELIREDGPCGRASAVLSCSDMTTLGLIGRMREEGISVPEDCSLVSYDNSPALNFANPGITAVDQDVPELSRQAFGLMSERMRHPDKPMESMVLVPRLVERGSVRPLA